MSFLGFCQQIQDTWLSQAISHSTWGYPIVGAIHVLVIALCGGAVLFTNLDTLGEVKELRVLKRIGVAIVVLTGVLLFISNPVRYYNSRFFQLKVLLLLLLAVNAIAFRLWRTRVAAYVSLGLWIAVIFAARGIAFF